MNFIKSFLIFLCFCSVTLASELKFNGRSEFYEWIAEGNDGSKVKKLHLQDHEQPMENEDFALMTQLFPNIDFLILDKTTHLTDDALLLLSNFPKLTGMRIHGNSQFSSFTSDVFFTIAHAAPQLVTFSLNGPLNTMDGNKLVQALVSMPHLKLVVFDDFDVAIWQTINNLKAARPSLTIYYNGYPSDYDIVSPWF